MGKIKKYPDGTSYAKVELSELLEFTFKINSYEDLWHLGQIVDVANHNGIRPSITVPCLLDAQADRRFSNDESSGLKLVCDFLNRMNADFNIFHPHNPEVVEALVDAVRIVDNSEFIEGILWGNNGIDSPELVLMSSDAGGFKPLMKLADQLGWRGGTSSASKARSYVNGKTVLTQVLPKEDYEGADILIVDDLCIYGGTFKGLATALKERNCGKLYLAVSHMTIQDLGEDPVTNYFDEVFTTNSKFDFYCSLKNGNMGNQPDNLTVIKLF